MHTTNYANTFIAVAEDSTSERSTQPPEKPGNPSIASRTWRMMAEHPYRYTSDDVIFTVWADRKGIPEDERDAARTAVLQQGTTVPARIRPWQEIWLGYPPRCRGARGALRSGNAAIPGTGQR